MTHPHDDHDPVEHDPTGMRALLGGLPDPGPMPDDLVARISASLADEVRVRDGWAVPDRPPGPHPVEAAPVRPLRRRPGLRVLAAAAAVVGVLGVGGLVVQLAGSGGIQAALDVSGSDGADSAAGGASDGAGGADDRGAEAEHGARVLAADPALGVTVLAGGGALSGSGLAPYAAGLAADTAERAPRALDGAAPVSALSPDGARDCAVGLGVPRSDPVLVQGAEVDGSPAVVLVATAASGARTGWAVSPTCSAADPGVLAGPVPVP